MNKKFFITTPIYYVNDVPHIGHLYTTLAADILTRHYCQKKKEVYFLTGTDEHGAKNADAAEKQKLKPKEYVDKMADQFKTVWEKYNINYDRFIRTTDLDHEKIASGFVNNLYKKGFIYKGEYHGLYCRGCEAYKKQSDLIDGKCPDHQTKPEELSEPCYFFKLSAFKKQVIEVIETNKMIIEPEIRRNEILSFLYGHELEDVAISRQNVSWGIKLPWDESHTIYVWFEALINYYTVGSENNIWPADLQLMSKDILRFHCVIWPAMLMALGLELPKKMYLHGYFTVDGQKMSKSIGNVINPLDLLEKYPADAVRYYLFNTFPFGADGDFSLEKMNECYNSCLANDLGNLLQRVLVMREKYNIDWEYIQSQTEYLDIDKEIENLNFSIALEKIWEIITAQNKKIDAEKPWELAKTDTDKLNILIKDILDKLSDIAILIAPIMPETSDRIIEQLKNKKAEVLFPKIN